MAANSLPIIEAMVGVLEPLTTPSASIASAAMVASAAERTRLLDDEQDYESPVKNNTEDTFSGEQEGVQVVEAITLVWSKSSLRLTYIL